MGVISNFYETKHCATSPQLTYICDRLPQNESDVATGEIEKTSRKGSFPDSRRFWDDFIFSIYILLTTRLALQGV